MIVLDTNVISELMRPEPASGVIAWVDAQPAGEVVMTAITAAEILHGVARLPEGKRKEALAAAAREMLEEDFADRVLAFDHDAAACCAEIVVQRGQIGRPIGLADAQIAAVARTRNAALATRNTRDFEGLDLELIDPWAVGGEA